MKAITITYFVVDVIGIVQLAFVNEIELRDISLSRDSNSRILYATVPQSHTCCCCHISKRLALLGKILLNGNTLVLIQLYGLGECSIKSTTGDDLSKFRVFPTI